MDEFYIVWTTRNGQKMWAGPVFSFDVAFGALEMNLNRSGGYILEIVSKTSYEEEANRRYGDVQSG